MSNNQLKELVATDPLTKFTRWLDDVKFPGYTFRVCQTTGGSFYLQAEYTEADTVTGAVVDFQKTRKWLLSGFMVKSEFVATAFKCILTSQEHRTREWFLYKGKAIYHPHYDVDALADICEEREVRSPVPV